VLGVDGKSEHKEEGRPELEKEGELSFKKN